MYGLVNRAIEDLVIQVAGEDAWQEICADANLQESGFENSVLYDDAVTSSLVTAASRKLEMKPEDVLHAFGRHWILYTGKEGWSTVFEMTGDDMASFLEGLDEMHARVRVAMPEADMPQFTLHREADHLTLEYHSSRDGLAPMVSGLLDGLAEYFSESWSVEHTGFRAVDGFDTFRLREVQSGSDLLNDAKAA